MSKSLFDALPMPPVANMLGWRFIASDAEAGTIDVGFDAKPEFANPAGNIQGGMLAAMMDDTMGPAVLIKSGGKLMCSTIELNIQYLRPVGVGPVTTRAKVVKLGRSIGFIECELFDQEGRLCAKATTSAALAPVPDAAQR